MTTHQTAATSVYTLRVELEHIEPLIWRRLQVRSGTTLSRLHQILQVAMGWTDCHLHLFRIGECEYGIPDDTGEFDIVDEKGLRLGPLLGESIRQFGYEYDFGDGWDHRIVLESASSAKPDWPYPLCVAGERACPPEDVGGSCGYQGFLDAIRNPEHADHDRFLRRAGGFFDPEGFDVNSVNRELRRLRL